MSSETTEAVVDTAGWVEYFRVTGTPAGAAVRALITTGGAIVTGPVVAELLQGARSAREIAAVAALPEVLRYEELILADWTAAGDASRRLKRKGVTVPLTDHLIAALARRLRIPVLTTDAHFKRLGVELFEF